MNEWNWIKGGVALAVVIVAAMVLVKPIGVSTQYVIADAAVWNLFDDQLIGKQVDAQSGKAAYSSSNAYLDKSHGKYAKGADNLANYGFVFVLSMVGGALLSVLTGGPKTRAQDRKAPTVWRERFGSGVGGRYLVAFLSGALVLFGARLAGGCTSGHMISGMTQTALSGYIFAAAVFLAAIPTALLVYRDDGAAGRADS